MSSDVIASVALQVKTADALAQIGKFENRLGALKQSASDFNQALRAAKDDGTKIAALCRERIATR